MILLGCNCEAAMAMDTLGFRCESGLFDFARTPLDALIEMLQLLTEKYTFELESCSRDDGIGIDGRFVRRIGTEYPVWHCSKRLLSISEETQRLHYLKDKTVARLCSGGLCLLKHDLTCQPRTLTLDDLCGILKKFHSANQLLVAASRYQPVNDYQSVRYVEHFGFGEKMDLPSWKKIFDEFLPVQENAE